MSMIPKGFWKQRQGGQGGKNIAGSPNRQKPSTPRRGRPPGSTNSRQSQNRPGRPPMSLFSKMGNNPSPTGIKGGAWKKIGQVPQSFNSSRSPPADPITPPRNDERFQVFREKWEADMKKKSPECGKVLRAGSGGVESPPGSGGSGTGVKRTASPWSDEGITPNPFVQALPKKSPDSFDTQATKVQRVSAFEEPETKSKLIPNSRGPIRPHRMPVSWMAAQDKSKCKEEKPIQPMMQKPSTISSYSVNSAQVFASPLDPSFSYPFKPNMKPQLHNYSRAAKDQANKSSGSFIETNSYLNPILPVLIRLNPPKLEIKVEDKPNTIEESDAQVKEQESMEKSSHGLQESDPIPSKNDEWEPTFAYGNNTFGRVERNNGFSSMVSSDITSDSDSDENERPL